MVYYFDDMLREPPFDVSLHIHLFVSDIYTFHHRTFYLFVPMELIINQKFSFNSPLFIINNSPVASSTKLRYFIIVK